MAPVLGANQLSGDADARPGLPHTSLQNEVNTEALCHFRHLHCFALVGEHGVPCHDEQPRNFRKIGDDVFGDTIAEIFLLRVAAHVVKGENRNGRSLLPRS